MDIKREQPIVSQYHFDARNLEWEKEKGTPETKFLTELHIVERDSEANTTKLVCLFKFMIVLEHFVISGQLMQGNHIQNRVIEEADALTDEEKRLLNAPLVEMLERLTYDVTEIAFDAPGLQLGLR